MAVAGPASGTDAMAAFIDIRRPEALQQIRQGYVARVPQLAAGRRITDKSPENFMFAGLIKASLSGGDPHQRQEAPGCDLLQLLQADLLCRCDSVRLQHDGSGQPLY